MRKAAGPEVRPAVTVVGRSTAVFRGSHDAFAGFVGFIVWRSCPYDRLLAVIASYILSSVALAEPPPSRSFQVVHDGPGEPLCRAYLLTIP